MSASIQMYAGPAYRNGVRVDVRRDDRQAVVYVTFSEGDNSWVLAGDPARSRAFLMEAVAGIDAWFPREPAKCSHCGAALQTDGTCPQALTVATDACRKYGSCTDCGAPLHEDGWCTSCYTTTEDAERRASVEAQGGVAVRG